MLTALIPAAVLGLIAFGLVSFRFRDAADLTPRSLLGLYLYLASLAAVLVFAIGVASLVNVAVAATGGNDFTYGRPPDPASFTVPACPPNTPECDAARAREAASNPAAQMLAQRDRRPADDLARGLTFTIFGGLFWGAHWLARRTFIAVGAPSPFGRGYLMAGTLLFGLVTVVLLPWGIYQALSTVFVPPAPGMFSMGVGDTLGGGIAALPIWLIYLRLAIRDLGSSAAGKAA